MKSLENAFLSLHIPDSSVEPIIRWAWYLGAIEGIQLLSHILKENDDEALQKLQEEIESFLSSRKPK